jgi:hypothetical protein
MPHARGAVRALLAMGLALVAAVGCGVHFEHLPAGSIAGRAGQYDYSPSSIVSGDVLQLWWCGSDANPSDRSQFSDSIQYESFNLSTNEHEGPFPVLGETQYAWDALFTCNPKVVRGKFVNSLGNGKTYTYAMYYVALGATGNNSIGVAFSNDGKKWKKYPKPIISAETQDGYGVGQPAVLNVDHNSSIRMFYEDYSYYVHHVEAVSNDGVHFTGLGSLTLKGMNPFNPQPSWGDMAFDPTTGYWYAGFQTATRDLSTTGQYLERGQYGIELYRIPDDSVLTGATPWQLLTTIDTNLTGYESNFIPAFSRDPYGNLNIGSYPTITMYTSIANPPPPWNASELAAGIAGDIPYWDIASASWTPGQPLRALKRYVNNMTHEVTTGWIDPKGGFVLESTLGHLYEGPQQGATLPFYGCKKGETDYFLAVDMSCDGARILGTNGYGYSKPVAGLKLVPLYRCSTSADHFASLDAQCEGHGASQLLGYVLP